MLVVFDLDFTLWDCGGTWCDHTEPPYVKKNGKIYDDYGSLMRLYSDSLIILEELQSRSVPVAIASRTSRPDWANELLRLFDIDRFFEFKEIYSGSKIKHFSELHRKTNIPFNQMLFFDDELRNVEEVGNLGVETVYVRNGIDWILFKNSLKLISAK